MAPRMGLFDEQGGSMMRFHIPFSIFLSFSFVTSAHAWNFPRTEAEEQETYRRIGYDYASNPIWSNVSLNLYRDGKLSRYLEPGHPFKEQGDPLTPEEIANLPEARFVSWKVFQRAIRGMRKILETYPTLFIRPDTLTVVDFDQTTESRRFIVLDLLRERVLFQTWVHHGRKSDLDTDRIPDVFSNVDSSNKSSLGFYLTEKESYEGRWGHSVRMHGLDLDLNSNIHSRAIVMHPWLPEHARRLAAKDPGQTSLGCLSLPYYESGKFIGMEDEPIAHLIIDHLKGRSLIYVHSSRVDLEKASAYLNGKLTPENVQATLAQVEADEGLVPFFEEALDYPKEEDRLY